MKIIDLILSANASLLRNKGRTALTIIAIFIGATTLSLTNGIGDGIKAYLTKQVGNLGNSSTLTITATTAKTNFRSSSGLVKYVPGQKKISSQGGGPNDSEQVALTQSDINKIAKVPNITSVQPTLTVAPDYIATVANPYAKYQFILNQTVGISRLDVSSGVNVNNNSSQYQVTLPISYLSSLGYNTSSSALNQEVTIGISNALGAQSTFVATIVGVQQKNLVGSTAAYANTDLFNALYGFQTTGLPTSTIDTYASIQAVFNPNLTTAQINKLKSTLAGLGYTAETIKDQVSTVFTVINAITYVFDGFAGITLVAAAFGIVNTLFMSVQERTKEIGLMKALGMGRRKIFALFSIEAVLIGFWGSILGIIFANFLGKIVNNLATKGFLKDFPGLNLLSFPAKASTIIVVGIMLIAFLAGTLPARRASRKDPIDALRYE
jgi:putative ABC transport system permease protein